MTDMNGAPGVASMAEFFTKSRTEFWLAQMQIQRLAEDAGEDPLPMLVRQQVATFVSHLNRCAYCSASHSCDIEILGGDADAIELAAVDLEAAPVDDKMRALLRFVRAMVSDPARFGAGNWEEAIGAGWDAAELESAIYVAAWYQFMNTIATGNLIPSTDRETALALARSRQKPGMYQELVDKLERLIRKKVTLSIVERS